MCYVPLCVKGMVVAYEGHVNEAMVVQNTGNSLLLKAYYPNTTYTAYNLKV